MSYIINKTTNELLITVLDGTADGPDINSGANAADVNLFGKNYPLYGQGLNENFIRLLQNFASTIAPTKPLTGELWFDISDSSNHVLRIYNNSQWLPVTPVWVATTAPTTTQVGAQWWDITNQQLNMYNGTSWTTVGPAWKATDGKSGAIVEDIQDTTNAYHTVIKFYLNNNVVAIASYDPTFTIKNTSGINGFNVISPGITLATGVDNNLFYGTAVNAQQLGNIAAVNYARNDIDSLFYGNVTVGSNLVISTNTTGSTARLTNTVLNSNVSIYNNVSGTLTRTLSINGATGEVTVSAYTPTNTYSLTTKTYVDTSIATATSPLAPSYSPAFSGIPTTPNVAYYANTAQIASMNSVQNAITYSTTAPWLGSQKTVSTGLPTNGQGNPGDFWFQI